MHRPCAVIEEHGKKQEEAALEFGESGDPSDRFRVHGMQGEDESGPEREPGRGQGGDEQVDNSDYSGVE